jgi:hypothetical protein
MQFVRQKWAKMEGPKDAQKWRAKNVGFSWVAY